MVLIISPLFSLLAYIINVLTFDEVNNAFIIFASTDIKTQQLFYYNDAFYPSPLLKNSKIFMCFFGKAFFNMTINSLVFSFELFYIVISGLFIADCAVWVLLIVEGHAVTCSC